MNTTQENRLHQTVISSRLTSPRPPLCLDTRWHTTTSTTMLRASPWSWWAKTPDNNEENLNLPSQLQSLTFFSLLVWAVKAHQRCLSFLSCLSPPALILLSFSSQWLSKTFVSLHCRPLPSKMIPLLGYLAVKYLINYPRFLLAPLPSVVHCRCVLLSVKQQVLLFVHQ